MLLGIRRVQVGATPLNPASAPGLTCWLRENRTLASGKLSQWTDKSGSGNHFTQATAGNQPTDVPTDTTLSNNQTVQFVPANYNFLTGPVKSSVISATAWTAYFIVKASSPVTAGSASATRCLLSDATTSGNSEFALNYQNVTTPAYRFVFGGNTVGAGAGVSGSLPEPVATWKKIVVYQNSPSTGTISLREAGGTAVTATANSLAQVTRAMKIGGYAVSGTADANSPFDGYIAEIIFCNQVHSTGVQDQIFAYQLGQFGI